MPDEWKPQIGEAVWCRGVVSKIYHDDVPYQVNFGRGGYVWMRGCELITEAPAPLTDAEVLRRAAAIMDREGAAGCDLPLRLAEHLDPPRVDVLAVLREAESALKHYGTRDAGMLWNISAAIKQMEGKA
jgi:hypothetical protein